MVLNRILLQNFRSYSQADFTFNDGVTFIIGPNTAGKSNIIEAIYLLAYGKSFRAEKDDQMIRFGQEIARVKGRIIGESNEELKTVEVMLAEGTIAGKKGLLKRYQVNDLPKRRIDFAGTIKALLFEPTDLDLVAGSPTLRREFLDEVLEQTDKEYRHALLTYTKALRHRNALLRLAQDTGIRNEKQFAYWDELIIYTGQTITAKREKFIQWINNQQQSLFQFIVHYDVSTISVERLLQYKDAEIGSGVTLVGPHRDDIQLFMFSARQSEVNESQRIEVRFFGSRGQQRLAVVQLKLLQLQYMHDHLTEQPILLLDDIFSELDEVHIRHVLDAVRKQQTIITTTHKEFLAEAGVTDPYMIELGK